MPVFPIDYTLPTDLIAQLPCEPRDHARLLVARRADQSLHHHHFYDLPSLLEPGDLLVINDTRVVPARLLGKRASTGGKWEGLFLRERPNACWEMLCQTRGSLREAEIIEISPGTLSLRLVHKTPEGRWLAQPLSPGSALELLEHHGQIPLPPYIRKGVAENSDRERYQTIYAQNAGAVAAPTAGLHFTERVFADLKSRGIGWTTVTLHVGIGTFQPIQVDDYTQHPMHREWGQLSRLSVELIADTKSRGKRVVAVGTTSVRVLESAYSPLPRYSGGEGLGVRGMHTQKTHDLACDSPPPHPSPLPPEYRRERGQEWSGDTDLFIHPPYPFNVVDALITNFHLPRTTLLLLVAALAGVELTRKAYTLAIADRYRFYSYGDAMLIV